MENFNVAIIDQQVRGLVEKYSDLLPSGDDDKKKSSAFVALCMSAYLDIEVAATIELLTDGGNDAGVDGIHIETSEESEFYVTIFQGKYKVKNLDGTSNFPENDVVKSINTVMTLFDPDKIIELNPFIKPKIEQIRSLVRDGYIPNVNIILCNNGAKWTKQAQKQIDNIALPKDQVRYVHFNHNSIIDFLKKGGVINDSLEFTGKAIVEDFNFKRVFIGKVRIAAIADLFERNGDVLLEKNIRRYLGLHSNRVNAAIYNTLKDDANRGNFYFFNNGITIICKKFRYNALQAADYHVKMDDMHIINGGQTCKTIQQNIKEMGEDKYNDVYVMVRIYELEDEDKDERFVYNITYATNNQNPVDLKDLHSNDEIQKKLEISIKELGYTYRRKRDDASISSNVITSGSLAEAVLAVWRRRPHQANFRRSEHFNKLYNVIFDDLNAAQAVLAVLIFRRVENERKRPKNDNLPDFINYASSHIAMLIGHNLLENNNKSVTDISHLNFKQLLDDFNKNQAEYYWGAISLIKSAIEKLYGKRDISLQQLAATFRRGDLLEILKF